MAQIIVERSHNLGRDAAREKPTSSPHAWPASSA